jgi:hypothetical protein
MMVPVELPQAVLVLQNNTTKSLLISFLNNATNLRDMSMNSELVMAWGKIATGSFKELLYYLPDDRGKLRHIYQ